MGTEVDRLTLSMGFDFFDPFLMVVQAVAVARDLMAHGRLLLTARFDFQKNGVDMRDKLTEFFVHVPKGFTFGVFDFEFQPRDFDFQFIPCGEFGKIFVHVRYDGL